jgi:hypothetical protein
MHEDMAVWRPKPNIEPVRLDIDRTCGRRPHNNSGDSTPAGKRRGKDLEGTGAQYARGGPSQ